MYRKALGYLEHWLTLQARKPLIIRGARQVGKTWLVRQFAKAVNLTLVEINFEKRPDRADLFKSNDPQQFLLACNKKILCEYLQKFDFTNTVPQSIHDDLLSLFREYVVVGGLPAVVFNWITTKSLHEVSVIHQDLLSTYRDDFSKYRGRINIDRLYETMNAVPKLLGEKFVFSRVNKDAQASSIKQSFELLSRARVCHRVSACNANGVPLAAEIKEKYFKAIFLDVGLCSASLKLNFSNIRSPDDVMFINQGGIAEQVVGQLLRAIDPFYMEPALFYWLRDEAGYNAEIDYLIQHGNKVIPFEVKAGSTGSLKSLHVFMELKKYPIAARVNADFPSKTPVSVKSRTGKEVRYLLLSIPFYLIGQITRLLNL